MAANRNAKKHTLTVSSAFLLYFVRSLLAAGGHQRGPRKPRGTVALITEEHPHIVKCEYKCGHG